MADKKCCSVDFTETEEGYRIDLTGEKIKDCLSSFMKCCCKKDDAKESKKKGD